MYKIPLVKSLEEIIIPLLQILISGIQYRLIPLMLNSDWYHTEIQDSIKNFAVDGEEGIPIFRK